MGVTPAQVAIAWVLALGDTVVPIPGTKRLRYLEQNVAAADVLLSDQDRAELDAIEPPVGDRY
jgi:aryl-alcohol dehydrogenase-like predicted oxidoreductase